MNTDALVFGRLDDFRGLEDLFVAPFRMQRLDPLGLEIVLAVPDRVDRGERDVLVGTVVAGDVVGKQVGEAEVRVGRAVLSDRSGGVVVLVAEQDQMRGADRAEVDEAVERLELDPGLEVGHPGRWPRRPATDRWRRGKRRC